MSSFQEKNSEKICTGKTVFGGDSLTVPVAGDFYPAEGTVQKLRAVAAGIAVKFHRNRQIGRTVQGENVILLAAAIRNLVFKTAGKADKGYVFAGKKGRGKAGFCRYL